MWLHIIRKIIYGTICLVLFTTGCGGGGGGGSDADNNSNITVEKQENWDELNWDEDNWS